MPVNSFYAQMAKSPAPLEPEMQREIISYARRTKSSALPVALIGRPDIDPEIEAELRESTDLAILTAWASRPNRTVEELQERLLRETRVAALLPLASMEDLPETVYRTVAKIKSAKLGEALAGNSSVPLDVRVEKVVEFASRRPRRSYGVAQILVSLCGTEADMYRAVARTSSVPGYLQACLESGFLDDKHVNVILGRLADIANSRDRTDTSDFNSLIGSLTSTALSEEQTEKVRKACEVVFERSKNDRYGEWTIRMIRENLEKIERRQSALSTKLKELAAVTGEDAFLPIYEEAKELVTGPEDREMLDEAVLSHEYSPTRLLVQHLENGTTYRRNFDNLVATRLDSRGAVDELAEILSRRSLSTNIDGLTNATAVVTKAVERTRARHAVVPYWIRDTQVVAANPQLAIEILPWNTLVEMLGTYNGREISGLVQQALLENFGQDRRLWETFETLGADFEGSLPELVGAIKQLI